MDSPIETALVAPPGETRARTEREQKQM